MRNRTVRIALALSMALAGSTLSSASAGAGVPWTVVSGSEAVLDTGTAITSCDEDGHVTRSGPAHVWDGTSQARWSLEPLPAAGPYNADVVAPDDLTASGSYTMQLCGYLAPDALGRFSCSHFSGTGQGLLERLESGGYRQLRITHLEWDLAEVIETPFDTPQVTTMNVSGTWEKPSTGDHGTFVGVMATYPAGGWHCDWAADSGMRPAAPYPATLVLELLRS